MPNSVTKEMIQTLARANGLELPEERLAAVLEQYEIYLQLLEQLDSFNLEMEAEPAIVFSLAPDSSGADSIRETR